MNSKLPSPFSRYRKRFLQSSALTLLLTVSVLLAFYQAWFLRLPEREIPYDPDTLLSPANGTVHAVVEWDQDSIFLEKGETGGVSLFTKDLGPKGTIIAITMDLFDVHYQRAPSDAEILRSQHVKGTFKNALIHSNRFKLHFENEHHILHMRSPKGFEYKVVQVAGVLARRIKNYVNTGSQLRQGEVYGLIKFGSQVAVVLPDGFDIAVKEGDELIEGESVLASVKKQTEATLIE